MLGYTENPSKFNMPGYEKVNADFIDQYYIQNIKEKTISIVIVGDKRKIDTKGFEKLGDNQYLNSSKYSTNK